MSQSFIQVQALKLAGSGITATATTIVLQSFKDPAGNDIVTADLGDATYGTLEPNTNREEIISFTTVTQNADGTATLTGVVRNLDYTTPYTQISATGYSHAGGTSMIVTNNPQMYEAMVSGANDENITGLYTFSTAKWPKMSDNVVDPTAGEELATKRYVDDTAGGTPISINRLIPVANAGDTISAGELVYLKAADGEWYKADASATGTIDKLILGIAQGSGTDGNPITGGVLIHGLDSNQSGMTPGAKMYATDTAGAIGSSAGTVEKAIGQAHSATELYFDPWSIDFPVTSAVNLIEGITASAVEINNLDGYTGSTALLNESATFFGATDITGAEAEKLTDGSNINSDSLHEHWGDGSSTSVTSDLEDEANQFMFFPVVAESNTIVGTFTDVTYTKKKEIVAGYDGTFTTAFSTSVGGASPTTVYGRIYVNGVAVGTERTITSPGDTGGRWTEGVTVSKGDLIQIYCKVSGSGNGNVYGFQIATNSINGFVVNI